MGNELSTSSIYKKGKGYCLIINNRKFAKLLSRGEENETSSHEKIKNAFLDRGFRVKILTDCTASEMKEGIQKLQNSKNYSSLFIFFLSHGYEGGVYGTNGVCLSFEEIQSQLTTANCPSFTDKPKILIFPTCSMGECPSLRATEDDFLLVFGIQPHSLVYKDEELGSGYIEKLLEVIEERGDGEHMEAILEEVQRKMRNNGDTVSLGPNYQSSLKDKLYLKAKRRWSRSRLVTGSDKKSHQTNGIQEVGKREEQVIPELSVSPSHCKIVPGLLVASTSSICTPQSLERSPHSSLESGSLEGINIKVRSSESQESLTELLEQVPNEVLNDEEFFSDEERVDREELSPTLLWDDMEVDKEGKEKERVEEREEEQETVTHTPEREEREASIHTPSIVCVVTLEGWVNVNTNINEPATIQEEEDENGFIMASLIPIREREVEDGWVEFY